MVVLDTSIVIDYLKGERVVIEKADKYSKFGDAAITFITEYELLKYKGDKVSRTINELIETFLIYHSDDKAAVFAAAIYRELERKGRMINENDILIAGICLSNNETLLTRDADFEMVDNKNIIVIK